MLGATGEEGGAYSRCPDYLTKILKPSHMTVIFCVHAENYLSLVSSFQV